MPWGDVNRRVMPPDAKGERKPDDGGAGAKAPPQKRGADGRN
jgi:hypothetical protein